MLADAAGGELDWKAPRGEEGPAPAQQGRGGDGLRGGEGVRRREGRPELPVPVAAIEAMQKGAGLGRDEALKIEAATFARIAKTRRRTASCRSSWATSS
jgi:hypothetical protein